MAEEEHEPRPGLAEDMLRAMDTPYTTIDWKPTPKLMEITREREVVFYGPEGLEVWRVPFDELVTALMKMVTDLTDEVERNG